jgi:hypothetical protein
MPLSQLKRLGRLELLSEVSVEVPGELFRGRDTTNSQEVGVHVLQGQGALFRFERAHHAAAALKHGNILAVRSLRAKSGIAYLVTEPVSGEPLSSMLKDGPLPIPRLLGLATQMARGLAAAHAAGVVHGDLKPGNVLVDSKDGVKIFGFALAPPFRPPEDPDEQVDAVIDYMAPEQLRGEPADARSDVYSFGAILYEMALGRKPFEAADQATLIEAIRERAPNEPPETIPGNLVAIMGLCLEKGPGARFQSAVELVPELEQCAEGPVEPAAETPPPPQREWTTAVLARWDRLKVSVNGWEVPRLRVGWIAVALGAAAIILVAAALISRLQQGPPVVRQFQRLTFRQGPILRARFAEGGKRVVYTARFDHTRQASYVTNPETMDSTDLNLPDGSSLAAVSSKGELALRLADGTLARRPQSGGDLRQEATNILDADWSPDGERLAVARYDPQSGRYRLEYPLGEVLFSADHPLQIIRISPKGDLVAFTDGDPSERHVGVVNRSGDRKILASLGLGEGTRTLSWSPDGKEIWYGSITPEKQGIIQAVGLDGKKRVVDWIPQAHLDDVTAGGRVLVEVFRSWSGILFHASAPARDLDLSWYGVSADLKLSADGRFIAFTEFAGHGTGIETVYVRRTDGSPAVSLGEGTVVAVSQDGAWISAYRKKPQVSFFLIPGGGGQAKPIEIPGLENSTGAVVGWLSGGSYLVWGRKPPGPAQNFVWNPASGKLTAVSPEGSSAGLASGNGAYFLAEGPDRRRYVFWMNGNKPRPALGIEPSEQMLGWYKDNQSVFVAHDLSIYRVNLFTGARAVWKKLNPLASVDSATPSAISADGEAYTTSYLWAQSDLFLANGSK